jgi:hypothetical protein
MGLALLVLGWMFSVMITQSALADDGFRELRHNPGLHICDLHSS